MKKILIVEDDKVLNKTLAYNLTADGYEVTSAYSFQDAVERLKKSEFDIALLDINLPDGNGLHLCDEIRGRGQHTYIMFITANDKEGDMLKGYEAGCTDYITKPFGMMELVSRVKAVLRRSRRDDKKDEIIVGDLKIYPNKHKVKSCGNEVTLTNKEFKLLCLLVESKGNVLNRDQLLTNIWGYDFDGETRTVDVHVRTLRQKLGQAGEYIETVRGVGYRIGEIDAK